MRRSPAGPATNPQSQGAAAATNGNSGRSMLVQWFPGWWYGYGAGADNTQLQAATHVTEDTRQLEGQLLEALG